MYTYKARLIRVIDGDTVDAEIDLGFGVYMKQRVRLYGINTPDSRSKEQEERERGLASKQRLTEILSKEFIIETILNKRGKFGRILGVLYVEQENGERENINNILVQEGFAKEYFGTIKDE
jgi:micrococcal nuclease